MTKLQQLTDHDIGALAADLSSLAPKTWSAWLATLMLELMASRETANFFSLVWADLASKMDAIVGARCPSCDHDIKGVERDDDGKMWLVCRKCEARWRA